MTPRKAPAKTAKQKTIAAKRSAKKQAAKAPARDRKRAVPAPTGRAADAPREYAAMMKIVLAAVPDNGRAVAHNSILDAARSASSNKLFPGDTHRMWAKQVLLDLQSKGVLLEDAMRPGNWRRA